MQYTRENAEKVMAGRKTRTWRPYKDGEYAVRNSADDIMLVRNRKQHIKWIVGRDYAVQPGRGKHAIGRHRITRIRHEQAGAISEADAIAEGFDDVQGFIDSLTALYGEWTPEQPGWALDFELVNGSR